MWKVQYLKIFLLYRFTALAKNMFKQFGLFATFLQLCNSQCLPGWVIEDNGKSWTTKLYGKDRFAVMEACNLYGGTLTSMLK